MWGVVGKKCEKKMLNKRDNRMMMMITEGKVEGKLEDRNNKVYRRVKVYLR